MEDLEEMRKSIDNLDNAIIAMLAERFKVTNKVGLYKAKNRLPAKDTAREAAQYVRTAELADHYGLNPDFAKSHLTSVLEQVVKNHESISIQFNNADQN